MKIALEAHFNPTCSVSAPPESFLQTDWFPRVLQRIEKFSAGFKRTFGFIDVYDWYRPFQEQERLVAGKSSKAIVSEHCFAAALDLEIPEEFHEKNTIDFISRLGLIDSQVRIGWMDYQKPNKKFTFCHLGWGFMVPFVVRKQYVYDYFSDPKAIDIYYKINRNWQPGVQW